jgi:hypothetical protein
MRIRWTEFFVGAAFASPANVASTSGANTVRAIPGRDGSISGATLVRRDTAHFYRQITIDKFRAGTRGDTPARSAVDRKLLFGIVMPLTGTRIKLGPAWHRRTMARHRRIRTFGGLSS